VRVKNREIPASYLSPSPSSPPARGRGNFIFYENIKIDELVKSQKHSLSLNGRGLG
jgi:hypothetical protein